MAAVKKIAAKRISRIFSMMTQNRTGPETALISL
jgi:hypothetical protein